MHWNKCVCRAALLAAFASFVMSIMLGCAPTSYTEGVGWVVDKHKAHDAKAQRIEDWPCMRADATTIDELDRALCIEGKAEGQQLAIEFLHDARNQGKASATNEFDRLSDDGWRELNRRYYGHDSIPDTRRRDEMRHRFDAETAAQFATLYSQIEQAKSISEIRTTLQPIRQNIEPSIKTAGRFGRAAPFALFTIPSLMIMNSIHSHEYRGPLDVPFESAIRFVPAAEAETAPLGSTDLHEWTLLVRHAPTIVQEWPKEANHARDVDLFGEVVARSTDNLQIDVERPVVYCYARDVWINGAVHKQLIYTHWYPEHPKIKPMVDPEQGKFEGVTLRLTLDRSEQRPMIFETVYNCGCYHRLYPVQSLEAAAAGQHGAPEDGKGLSIERNVPFKIDMIVPKAVCDNDNTSRPVVRCRAGWHGPVDVALSEGDHEKEVIDQRAYALHSYDELEHLPIGDNRFTSMFYENGLVKNAQRMEGVFFTPIGILSAGQPRQRGTQLIHWDQWDLDDPQLFEKTLRLPDVF